MKKPTSLQHALNPNKWPRCLACRHGEPKTNRRLAAMMSQLAVSHAGKSVWPIDYHFEGRLTQDFAFL